VESGESASLRKASGARLNSNRSNEEPVTMPTKPPTLVWGRSPTYYGLASLGAACLAWISWPLVVLGGVFLVGLLALLLAFLSVLLGLWGVGAGLYDGNRLAIATAALGLFLIGFGAWNLALSLGHF
jgi:hypothetical protein